jgi:hypothetical protein
LAARVEAGGESASRSNFAGAAIREVCTECRKQTAKWGKSAFLKCLPKERLPLLFPAVGHLLDDLLQPDVVSNVEVYGE